MNADLAKRLRNAAIQRHTIPASDYGVAKACAIIEAMQALMLEAANALEGNVSKTADGRRPPYSIDKYGRYYISDLGFTKRVNAESWLRQYHPNDLPAAIAEWDRLEADKKTKGVCDSFHGRAIGVGCSNCGQAKEDHQ